MYLIFTRVYNIALGAAAHVSLCKAIYTPAEAEALLGAPYVLIMHPKPRQRCSVGAQTLPASRCQGRTLLSCGLLCCTCIWWCARWR